MKNWSLNAKIYFVLCIFVLASAVISVLGISKLGELKTAMNDLVSGPSQRTTRAQDIQAALLTQIVNQKNFILEDSLEGMKTFGKRSDDTDKDIRAQYEAIHKIVTAAGRIDMENFMKSYEQFWVHNNQIRDLGLQGKDDEANKISSGPARELRAQMQGFLNNIIERNKTFTVKSLVDANDSYNLAKTVLIGTSVGAIVLGFLIATIILRSLSTSINQVINSLTDSSNQVTSAAQQIATSSEGLSQATTQQAASLEETAASIEEMSSMVQKNADSARRTADLSGDSTRSANKGKQVVVEMIQAIDNISESNNSIKEQIEQSNQQISDIVKVIAEIGNKTKVINEIVFQTKLLSFNASVEAARAGEHGKGFAVVAEEVGNLAQMSGNAAKEITEMLDGSIQKVESIVNETKDKVSHLIIDGKAKVEAGTLIARQCGEVLNEIVENVASVNQMASEISNACQEQAQGVQEITKAMNQLDQVTQTNAATSEETASAAEELSSQSESLRSTVGVLIQTIKGADAHHITPSHQARPNSDRKTVQHKTPANVVPMVRKKVEHRMHPSPKENLKQASGSGNVPSENDPRFEDV